MTGSENTILVTGGAGFIGSHLVERLLVRGDSVICVDNFNSFYDPGIKRGNIKNILKNKNFTGNFNLIDADIRDMDKLETAFKDVV